MKSTYKLLGVQWDHRSLPLDDDMCFEPICETADIQKFYALRVLQIFAFIHNSLSDVKVCIMCNDRVKEMLQGFWNEKQMT